MSHVIYFHIEKAPASPAQISMNEGILEMRLKASLGFLLFMKRKDIKMILPSYPTSPPPPGQESPRNHFKPLRNRESPSKVNPHRLGFLTSFFGFCSVFSWVFERLQGFSTGSYWQQLLHSSLLLPEILHFGVGHQCGLVELRFQHMAPQDVLSNGAM